MLRTHRLIFRQIAPGLSHDPNGHPLDGLEAARSKEKLFSIFFHRCHAFPGF